MSNLKQSFTAAYAKQSGMAYPAEYVIRIFKGTYPGLQLDRAKMRSERVCDVSCGDGRNMLPLADLGLQLYGTEITAEIVAQTKAFLVARGLEADVRVGTNDALPFPSDFFDHLLSWNAIYYMDGHRDFGKHVSEHARILRRDGTFVLSIPKKTCFIYKNCEDVGDGFVIIREDPFGIREGAVMRRFEDEADIVRTFSSHFKDFAFGSDHDDCFGLDYHWHLVVCRRR